MMQARPAAVAGMFYPGDPAELDATVRGLLDRAAATDAPPGPRPKAVIVPHAGFRYSGEIAASAYHLLAHYAASYSRVVLIGPAHRVYVDGIALPGSDAFAFPGGVVPLDTAALTALESVPGVSVSAQAHAQEHCLEVQLPFLSAVLGSFSLVPLLVGGAAPDRVATVLREVWGGEETLVVVSSDLSHYLPYDEAVAIDRRTTADIVARSTRLDGSEACGANAINGLMVVAAEQNLSVNPLDVRNSGDTAGDRSRVVGYGAYALH